MMMIRNDKMMQKQEPGRMDVKSLVSRLQAGEPSAVRVFVKMYGPRVHGYLRCLVHSPETAEDLTQEVLTKSYQKCGQIESAEKFESWLFTLARNMAYKEMKRKHYRVEFTRDVEWFDTRDGGNADHPARNFGADECARFLSEALCTLSEKRREIMALRYYSGLSLQAIADLMQIPIGSIGTTITRSLERLKKYFDSRDIKVEDLL